MKKSQNGFTLIELMIVVAIVGILAAVALPAYQNYSKKAKFSEVVAAGTAVKSAVEICYQTNGAGTDANNAADLSTCDTAAEIDYTLADASAGQFVSGVTVTSGTAAIVATAVSTDGLAGATVTLTPAISNGGLTWTSTCSVSSLC